MKISWVVPCRYIEQGQNGHLTMVGAGLDRVAIRQLPAIIPLRLGVRLSFDGMTVGTSHKLTGEVRAPSMETLEGGLDLTVNVPPAPAEMQGQVAQFLLVLNWQFPAVDAGTYTITLAVDGVSADSVCIRVDVPT